MSWQQPVEWVMLLQYIPYRGLKMARERGSGQGRQACNEVPCLPACLPSVPTTSQMPVIDTPYASSEYKPSATFPQLSSCFQNTVGQIYTSTYLDLTAHVVPKYLNTYNSEQPEALEWT